MPWPGRGEARLGPVTTTRVGPGTPQGLSLRSLGPGPASRHPPGPVDNPPAPGGGLHSVRLMDFTVSVHLPRRRRTVLDVVVEDGADVPPEAAAHTVADLRAGLAALLGEPVPGLLLGGMPLADAMVLGRPPLLHGCSLVVAGPAPAATRGSAPGSGSPPGARPARPWQEAATTALTLAVTGGPDCGHLRPVPSGGLTVGRSGGCDLVLDDPDLSRRHARLSLSAGGLDVADLGSTNGVGRQAGPAVRLGASTLRLRPADQARVPTSPTSSAGCSCTARRGCWRRSPRSSWRSRHRPPPRPGGGCPGWPRWRRCRLQPCSPWCSVRSTSSSLPQVR